MAVITTLIRRAVMAISSVPVRQSNFSLNSQSHTSMQIAKTFCNKLTTYDIYFGVFFRVGLYKLVGDLQMFGTIPKEGKS
jgi:hypothetical protein